MRPGPGHRARTALWWALALTTATTIIILAITLATRGLWVEAGVLTYGAILGAFLTVTERPGQ